MLDRMKFLLVIIALAMAADLFDRGWTFFPWLLLYGVAEMLMFEPARRAVRRWWRQARRADPDSDTMTCFLRAFVGWPRPPVPRPPVEKPDPEVEALRRINDGFLTPRRAIWPPPPPSWPPPPS